MPHPALQRAPLSTPRLPWSNRCSRNRKSQGNASCCASSDWCSIISALLTGFAQVAQAQATYPDRPVKFVIAFPPGGATDTFFRMISNELGTALGQAVVIENKGGAGGYIAWQAVAASPADGYTVLVAENALGINQALFKKHPSGFNPLQRL